VLQKFSFIL